MTVSSHEATPPFYVQNHNYRDGSGSSSVGPFDKLSDAHKLLQKIKEQQRYGGQYTVWFVTDRAGREVRS